MAGDRDVRRIRDAVDRMREMGRLVDQQMRAVEGNDWASKRRKRLRKEGRRVFRNQGLHDPRLVIRHIAEEPPLANVYSQDERAKAARLHSLANAAMHSDVGSLTAEDATWAETTVEHLLEVGRAALQPEPRKIGPDVHAWVRRAHDDARADDHERARVGHEAMRRRVDWFERAWGLQHTLATFRGLMAAAGDPGTEPVRRRPRDFVAPLRLRPRFRGWAIAYRPPRGEYRQPGLRLVLAVDGSLWLCAARPEDVGSLIRARVSLDPQRPCLYAVRFDWTVKSGDGEYIGDGPTGGIPFRSGWCSTAHGGRPCAVDDAIAARIGALCVTHALAWPDDDPAVAERLTRERVAFVRDPPPLEVPAFPLRHRLTVVRGELAAVPAGLRRTPSWVAAPLLWGGAVLAISHVAFLAVLAGIGALGAVVYVRQLWGPPDQRHEHAPELADYLRGAVFAVVGFWVLALCLELALR